jgi:hypothetical protein
MRLIFGLLLLFGCGNVKGDGRIDAGPGADGSGAVDAQTVDGAMTDADTGIGPCMLGTSMLGNCHL